MYVSGWVLFFCFKQKTAYEMRISDWSSDVCSSDLLGPIGQIFSGLKQAFPHLLAREIEIGVVGKDRRNLAEAIARDRARRLEPGNAGKRDFDRISDQLPDFDRRKTRVKRIDLHLLVGDETGRAPCREKVYREVELPVAAA